MKSRLKHFNFNWNEYRSEIFSSFIRLKKFRNYTITNIYISYNAM